MHILYSKLVKDEHMTKEQRAFSRRNFGKGVLGLAGAGGVAALSGCSTNTAAAQSCAVPEPTRIFKARRIG